MPKTKAKLWTKYEEAHMKALSTKYSWSRISTMLGRSKSSVARRANKIGCYRGGPRWMGSDRGLKLAILRGAGVSFEDISRLMNVSKPSCYKAFTRNQEDIIEIWRNLLLDECSDKLRAIGLSEKTVSKFRVQMEDAYMPRMDLLSMALEVPELKSALQSVVNGAEDT